MAHKMLGTPAALPLDAATKSYTDMMDFTSVCPSTYFVMSPGYLSTAANAVSSGRISFHPFWLREGTYTKMAVSVGTAQSGGTTSLVTGIYADNGSGYCPDTSKLLMKATMPALTTAGVRSANSDASATLSTGLYWAAAIYVASSAPTTAPTLQCVVNSMWSLPHTSGNPMSRVRGFALTGKTVLPTDTTAQAFTNFTASAGQDLISIAIGTG